MEPVETILVPISKAAGCTIICEASAGHHCSCRQTAKAVLNALEDAGLCAVPREPTKEMLVAGQRFSGKTVWNEWFENGPGWQGTPAECWRAMIAATPTPSRTEEGD
jgi:hypothetical protein